MKTIAPVAFCLFCIPAAIFIGHLTTQLLNDWRRRDDPKALALALMEFGMVVVLLIEIICVVLRS